MGGGAGVVREDVLTGVAVGIFYPREETTRREELAPDLGPAAHGRNGGHLRRAVERLVECTLLAGQRRTVVLGHQDGLARGREQVLEERHRRRTVRAGRCERRRSLNEDVLLGVDDLDGRTLRQRLLRVTLVSQKDVAGAREERRQRLRAARRLGDHVTHDLVEELVRDLGPLALKDL